MLNKVILIGRLGKDPEVRQTNQGSMRCTISLATDEVWRDKGSGEKQTKTEWHRVVFYNRLAEIASQYLKKGSLIYVEGKITSYTYTGQDGIERRMYEISANEMKMFPSRSEHSQGQTNHFGHAAYPPNAPYGHANFNAAHGSDPYVASRQSSYPANGYPTEIADELYSTPQPQSPAHNAPPPSMKPSTPLGDELIEDDVPF